MVECSLHPTAGRRYVHVFPSDPFLSEIRDCYRSAARRLPWMVVHDLAAWSSSREDWQDPELVVIFWGCLPTGVIPERRRSALVARYTESVGLPEGLNAVQRQIVERYTADADVPDLLLGGTPTVADFWSGKHRATAFAPIGYEPEILGRPDWTTPKTIDFAFRGTLIGRRLYILKKLQKSFPRLGSIHSFGLERKFQLDRALIDLYIGHSSDLSFPGMRLWQGIASSAALVTEPRDAWPAVAGRHYIEVPEVDPDLFGFFVENLRELLQDTAALRSIAETAHKELSVYTVDRCMEGFVVPATKGLRG